MTQEPKLTDEIDSTSCIFTHTDHKPRLLPSAEQYLDWIKIVLKMYAQSSCVGKLLWQFTMHS